MATRTKTTTCDARRPVGRPVGDDNVRRLTLLRGLPIDGSFFEPYVYQDDLANFRRLCKKHGLGVEIRYTECDPSAKKFGCRIIRRKD